MEGKSFKYLLQTKIGEISPKLISYILYYHAFHKILNLKNPKNLNEYIQWMKFYGDTSMWPLLADKYKVRDYVKDKGLSDTLVHLYGAWKTPEDIDWDTLPNQFVLKMNNGCGDVMICEDKQSFDKEFAVGYFNKMLNSKFGLSTGQTHYQYIEPYIIAEELLDKTHQAVHSCSLIDYKFWCINGEPMYCMVIANRKDGKAQFALYDKEWEQHKEYLVETEEFKIIEGKIPPPVNLKEMLMISKKLSEGHPQMRVDLYEVNNKVYFGELTMTSACGLMTYFNNEFLELLGRKIKIS